MRLTQLNESTEVTTIVASPINKLTKHHLEQFQELCRVVLRLIKSDNALTGENVADALSALNKFDDLPFVKNATEKLEAALKKFNSGQDTQARRSSPDHKAKRKQAADDFEAALLGGNFNEADSLADVLGELFSGGDDLGVNVDSETKDIMKYAFTKGMSFMGSSDSDDVIDTIDASTYKEASEVDLDTHYYSYTDFPRAMLNSPDYMMAFILNLTTDRNPKRINALGNLRVHNKMAKANSESYQKLLGLVDRYLVSNRKELIPNIMAELEKHPELVRANNQAKRKISKVYRGIPDFDGSMTSHEVLQADRDAKIVATSTSRHSAMNFAKAKGHMETDSRAETGWLIEYDAENAIVLVTTILGTVYGEEEVLIDTTKAGVIDIEMHEFLTSPEQEDF